MFLDDFLVLEEWLAALQTQLFGKAIERDDAAIVIAEYDGGPIAQYCAKSPFARNIETGTIDERIYMPLHRTCCTQ